MNSIKLCQILGGHRTVICTPQAFQICCFASKLARSASNAKFRPIFAIFDSSVKIGGGMSELSEKEQS